MQTWDAVLLIYREIDVRLRVSRWRKRRFHWTASEQQISDAVQSFRGFPQLVRELTDGAADVVARVADVEQPLTSLTRESATRFWPSPQDTRGELDRFAPAGTVDSVFVFWPQRNVASDDAVPCDAWGLALPASDSSNGATYAAVANAPTAAWRGEARGEVWLHEWLHGVCAYFARQGFAMPQRDADGAELHGYTRSASRGWCDYYRDLMTGNVREGNELRGIPLAAWRDSKVMVA